MKHKLRKGKAAKHGKSPSPYSKYGKRPFQYSYRPKSVTSRSGLEDPNWETLRKNKREVI